MVNPLGFDNFNFRYLTNNHAVFELIQELKLVQMIESQKDRKVRKIEKLDRQKSQTDRKLLQVDKSVNVDECLSASHIFSQILPFYGSIPEDESVNSRQMSAQTNVRLDECPLRQMYAQTNVCLDECPLRQISAQTNVCLDKCLLRRMSAWTNVCLDKSLLG